MKSNLFKWMIEAFLWSLGMPLDSYNRRSSDEGYKWLSHSSMSYGEGKE